MRKNKVASNWILCYSLYTWTWCCILHTILCFLNCFHTQYYNDFFYWLSLTISDNFLTFYWMMFQQWKFFGSVVWWITISSFVTKFLHNIWMSILSISFYPFSVHWTEPVSSKIFIPALIELSHSVSFDVHWFFSTSVFWLRCIN